MKALIPAACAGTRLRLHTYTKIKGAMLKDSVIGDEVILREKKQIMNVGEHRDIEIG